MLTTEEKHILLHLVMISIDYFFDKQGYLDLFEYLTIPLDMCNPPVPHTPGYYREKPLEGMHTYEK